MIFSIGKLHSPGRKWYSIWSTVFISFAWSHAIILVSGLVISRDKNRGENQRGKIRSEDKAKESLQIAVAVGKIKPNI